MATITLNITDKQKKFNELKIYAIKIGHRSKIYDTQEI